MGRQKRFLPRALQLLGIAAVQTLAQPCACHDRRRRQPPSQKAESQSFALAEPKRLHRPKTQWMRALELRHEWRQPLRLPCLRLVPKPQVLDRQMQFQPRQQPLPDPGSQIESRNPGRWHPRQIPLRRESSRIPRGRPLPVNPRHEFHRPHRPLDGELSCDLQMDKQQLLMRLLHRRREKRGLRSRHG